METELLNAGWAERDVFFHDRPAYQQTMYLCAQVLNVEWVPAPVRHAGVFTEKRRARRRART